MKRIIKIISISCFVSLLNFSFMCCTQNISGEDQKNTQDTQRAVTEHLSTSKSVYSASSTTSSSSLSFGNGGK